MSRLRHRMLEIGHWSRKAIDRRNAVCRTRREYQRPATDNSEVDPDFRTSS